MTDPTPLTRPEAATLLVLLFGACWLFSFGLSKLLDHVELKLKQKERPR